MSGRDEIALTGLRVFGHHGVFDFEREQGQYFVVDLRMTVSAARAAQTDDVVDTVHYGEVAEAVVAVVAGEPVNLIETLASRIAGVVLEGFAVEAVSVTVHKPQAPIEAEFADVAVTVHRDRSDAPVLAATHPDDAPSPERGA